jgi:hypothetical protein
LLALYLDLADDSMQASCRFVLLPEILADKRAEKGCLP